MSAEQSDSRQPAEHPADIKIVPELRVCANCVWWDGSRRLIKQFPAGRPAIDVPPVFFTKVPTTGPGGQCLAPDSSKVGTFTQHAMTCLRFKSYFKGTQADPEMALVHVDQACCATCSWWDGERKLIKREERGENDRVLRKLYYLRVERARKERCLNKGSDTFAKPFEPVQHCNHYRFVFT
ncbi:MAG: hypothetical protein ACKO3C_14520 [Betaproteobacteria bacterium]